MKLIISPWKNSEAFGLDVHLPRVDSNHQDRKIPSPRVISDIHRRASEKNIQHTNISINEPTPYVHDMRISAPFPGIR